MKLLPTVICLLLVAVASGVQAADPPPPADPFDAAAARIKLQIYRPSSLPDGFTLGSVQLVTDPSDMLIATYYSADERQLHLLESTPEGLECPECPTIDIGGVASPYSREDQSDGTALVDLTVIRGGTAIVLGLRQKGLDTNKALLMLRPVAEGLVRVEAGKTQHAAGRGSALSEAASRASFAVYAPDALPQFFYLKTVAYSPRALAEDGDMATPEQVAITYASPEKEITIVVQPPDAFALEASKGRTRVTVRGWDALAWREAKQSSLALDAGDAMVLLTGNVQQATLLSVARSLSRVK